MVSPEWHSVVYDGNDIYHGNVFVEKGILTIFVGGGQPQYFDGKIFFCVKIHGNFLGFLSEKVVISDTQPLSNC